MAATQTYLRSVSISYGVVVLFVLLYATRTACLNLESKSSFDHRECRSRGAWKGDVGALSLIDPPKVDDAVNHPRNILKAHSRKKRFISFPEGSSLTVKNELRIKKNSHDRHDFTLLVGLPFTIDLPGGPLQLSKFSSDEEEEEEEEEEPPRYNYIRLRRRAVDRQRKTVFDFIESTLNSFGLPGKSCLLKAICESAEDPLDSTGMLGEVLNVFLAASFGGNTKGMSEFIAAEEEGRKNASCSLLYEDCPFHLMDFLHSGLSIVHSGLVSASNY